MKSKTFFIYGSDFASLEACDNPDFYILNRKYFSNHIVIGDPVKGIALEEMDRLLVNNINQGDQIINIVLNMHGWPDEVHKHVLEILPPPYDGESEINIPTENVLRSIVDVIGGKPVNIFTPTCYGGNMHAFTDLLPNGSTLITLSDIDKPGVGYDFYNKMMQEMLQSAQLHGDTFKYLLPIVTLSTKCGSSTPMISRKTADGSVEQLDLPYIANQFYQSPLKPTPFLSGLFKDHVLEESALVKLIALIKSGVDISLLKQPPLLKFAYHAWKKGEFEAFKIDIEAKYYQPGALARLNIDFASQQHLWDMRDEMSIWDQDKTNAFARFIEMQKLLVQGKLPNEDVREWMALNDQFSKYETGINDLQNLEEKAYQCTLATFDQTYGDEYNSKCNILEPICNAIPNYNILLGVAATQVVEELF